MNQPTDNATSISLVLAGSGGSGVITAGNMLLAAAAKAGWYGLMTRSAGPQIRGGEAAALLRLSSEPVSAQPDRYDLIIALDWMNFERFADEMPLDENTVIIGDASAAKKTPAFVTEGPARRGDIDFKSLSKAIPGGRPNMIALGTIGALIGLPEDALDAALSDALAKRGEDAIAASRAGAEAGRSVAADMPATPKLPTPEGEKAGRWLISGNEAAGLGAIRGGVRFVAAYPITPATEILEWMSPALTKVGGVLVQAEDELASINMAIGGSYGGVPALTATSGPGLALMTEAIGLAVASEVPVVIVDVMRGGPSTGIPTKSEQSDLNMALYALPGDAPHIVVAPNSIRDCVFTTQWSVHLAEAMQTPAIVLSDQALGQAKSVIAAPADIAFIAQRETASTPVSGENYERYAVTASGVSPMALPGTPGCAYTADGLEHNPRGTPSGGAKDHHIQLDKRQRKTDDFDYGQHWADEAGDGDTVILTWGSCTGPVLEALENLAGTDNAARMISMRLLMPAPKDQLTKALEGAKRVIVVEQTHSGQFMGYLRANIDLPRDVEHYCIPGPLPMRPGDIVSLVKEGTPS
jgi:2-oxoglutarate/2-oxoacid ferredoxin oxidoreductase subunit alpha